LGNLGKEMLYIDKRAEEEGLPRNTVLKEALQVLCLEHLYALPETEGITFQGGTCLRFLYGGPRYSEDLDFVVSDMQKLSSLFKKIGASIEKMGSLFERKIWMKVQKESKNLIRWKLYFETLEGRENSSVSIEFANYPAYTSQLLPLKVPRGYPSTPLILAKVETEEEILADKINSIAARRYLKGRDIFDVWFLKSKGVEVNVNMVEKKFKDYSTPKVKIEKKVSQFSEKRIRQDLENYLPKSYRERFRREGYEIMLEATREVVRKVDRQLG
jgi:predicted nucleotidyltransferase component of viral defense system